MMKKRNSIRIVMSGLALLLLFLILQMCLFSYSSLTFFSNVSNHSTKPQQVTIITQRNPIDQPIVCDRSHTAYDICEINGPTVLDPTKSTFYTMGQTGPKSLQKIRPYPRKSESSTMSRIRELTLISGPIGPISCKVKHESPALVFSAGGYTGNFFHEFSDGFIPLFITVRSLFDDERRDLVLVISKYRDWWAHKYSDLLRSFTDHPIVDLDGDTETHCFPSAKLGLISHGLMTINPNLNSTIEKSRKALTLSSFRGFLDESYGGRENSEEESESNRRIRPRLVLVSRVGRVGRVLVNEREVKKEAERVGFRVVFFRPTWKTTLSQSYELMSTSHAVIGVHGAGLTNAVLFLRHGSTLIQIVPLGNDWLAKTCFGRPAVAMGLEYAEYMIKANESTLVEKYGIEETVISDPVKFRGKGWSNEAMDIYLKEQDVRLDLDRFRRYLKRAYANSIRLMERDG